MLSLPTEILSYENEQQHLVQDCTLEAEDQENLGDFRHNPVRLLDGGKILSQVHVYITPRDAFLHACHTSKRTRSLSAPVCTKLSHTSECRMYNPN